MAIERSYTTSYQGQGQTKTFGGLHFPFPLRTPPLTSLPIPFPYTPFPFSFPLEERNYITTYRPCNRIGLSSQRNRISHREADSKRSKLNLAAERSLTFDYSYKR